MRPSYRRYFCCCRSFLPLHCTRNGKRTRASQVRPSQKRTDPTPVAPSIPRDSYARPTAGAIRRRERACPPRGAVGTTSFCVCGAFFVPARRSVADFYSPHWPRRLLLPLHRRRYHRRSKACPRRASFLTMRRIAILWRISALVCSMQRSCFGFVSSVSLLFRPVLELTLAMDDRPS